VLTRRQLYELYDEGSEATIHYIEGLLEELADHERFPGEYQRRIIEAQHERKERETRQLQRVKQRLARQECLNYRLKRRVAELEAAAVVRDSHTSSLPPSQDPPAARAANSIKRNKRGIAL
jgi:hypothetical protein